MIDRIKVFKQNHIRIESGGRIIHIDPLMTDESLHDADFILITHDHHDHFSPVDIEKTAGDRTVLIVPEKMREKARAAEKFVGKIVTVKPVGTYSVDRLEFETVPAYNIAKPFHPKAAGWVGYILCLEGRRVYVAGDTDATGEARSVRCDIALLPAGGTYTMNAKQAAELANVIKPGIAVPVHYGGNVGSVSDGEKFSSFVDKDIKVVLKI